MTILRFPDVTIIGSSSTCALLLKKLLSVVEDMLKKHNAGNLHLAPWLFIQAAQLVNTQKMTPVASLSQSAPGEVNKLQTAADRVTLSLLP
ncbi:hypothetical protein NPIL_12521 [Nephila pilipes]|uniref:Uncharacterized protein n=1 Tax=Nephila pilipes TaxID=299642 RepID=A0A8X6QVA3_NEPPI|nr:hypothetical protein NPIL_12521 [Nephila pilipes]